MRKIPEGAEATAVLVGKIYCGATRERPLGLFSIGSEQVIAWSSTAIIALNGKRKIGLKVGKQIRSYNYITISAESSVKAPLVTFEIEK